MVQSLKKWFLIQGLEWAVYTVEGQDIMKKAILQILSKSGMDKETLKSLMISLLEDWISEVKSI